MGQIRSNIEIADTNASNISGAVSHVGIDSLAGVNDDNTLAESGIYNSAASLKQTFDTLAHALMADAGHLRDAASHFDKEDGAAAGSF